MSDETSLQTRADNSDDKPQELLRVGGLSYKYGSFHALSDVSFSAGAGELIALVGRNGAGKSTLLRCIAGWTRASEGEVHIMGAPQWDEFSRNILALIFAYLFSSGVRKTATGT